MEFGWPVMLWALSAAPLLLWAYLRAQHLRARQEVALADPHLLPHLWTRPSAVRRHLPAGFYVAAVALLTLALARPIAAVPLPTNRAALILAIDVSKSMIGEDAKPNRLAAAKAAAEQVLAAVPGSTRVGLLTFSDYAQVLVPPTTERTALREALAACNGFIPLPMIRNQKNIDPRDKTSPKVYQLETAMGAAIECFAGASAIEVPRSRFAPVKTTGDLLAVRSDAYELDSQWRLTVRPERHGRRWGVLELAGAWWSRRRSRPARRPARRHRRHEQRQGLLHPESRK